MGLSRPQGRADRESPASALGRELRVGGVEVCPVECRPQPRHVGDRELAQGKLLAADKARSIYEGYVRQNKDPALLEWQRGGRFELRIFPIPKRGSRRIVLAYTGWQTHAVVPARHTRRLDPSAAPVSTALGVLGKYFVDFAFLEQMNRRRTTRR